MRGADGLSGKDSETRHLAAGRGMTLALSALRCLVRHLGLVEDSANHGTFSLVIGEHRMDTSLPVSETAPLYRCRYYFDIVILIIIILMEEAADAAAGSTQRHFDFTHAHPPGAFTLGHR